MLVVSDTLFNVIIWNEPATEKRLMIDVKASREAYNEGIISNEICIRREIYLADAMTKSSILPQFVEALNQNQLYYEVEQIINRTIRSSTN